MGKARKDPNAVLIISDAIVEVRRVIAAECAGDGDPNWADYRSANLDMESGEKMDGKVDEATANRSEAFILAEIATDHLLECLQGAENIRARKFEMPLEEVSRAMLNVMGTSIRDLNEKFTVKFQNSNDGEISDELETWIGNLSMSLSNPIGEAIQKIYNLPPDSPHSSADGIKAIKALVNNSPFPGKK